jgi:hypothetical protein
LDSILIDGRNRLPACNGEDNAAVIVSANLKRRNLMPGQRAIALAFSYPVPAKLKLMVLRQPKNKALKLKGAASTGKGKSSPTRAYHWRLLGYSGFLQFRRKASRKPRDGHADVAGERPQRVPPGCRPVSFNK